MANLAPWRLKRTNAPPTASEINSWMDVDKVSIKATNVWQQHEPYNTERQTDRQTDRHTGTSLPAELERTHM